MADKPIDDGGPAFPIVAEGGHDSGLNPELWPGMSLRDWFAGMVLQGMLSGSLTVSLRDPLNYEETNAKDAYGLADAMIKMRTA